jgi:hypothetical protein
MHFQKLKFLGPAIFALGRDMRRERLKNGAKRKNGGLSWIFHSPFQESMGPGRSGFSNCIVRSMGPW